MLDVAFDHGNERAEAITLPVLLENTLEALLRLSLRSDATIANEMFRPSGPLGNFGTKVRMAYMIGILAREPMEDFFAISKIRNRFAHDPDVKDFEHADIIEIVARMHITKTLKEMIATEPDESADAFAQSLYFVLSNQLDTNKGFFREGIRLYTHRLIDVLKHLESGPAPVTHPE